MARGKAATENQLLPSCYFVRDLFPLTFFGCETAEAFRGLAGDLGTTFSLGGEGGVEGHYAHVVFHTILLFEG